MSCLARSGWSRQLQHSFFGLKIAYGPHDTEISVNNLTSDNEVSPCRCYRKVSKLVQKHLNFYLFDYNP
jgi:hypothetical protein